MSLQGTLDTFALPDVLRLLSSTGKTGLLSVDGSRGSGRVWMDGGQVVGAEVSAAGRNAGPTVVLFELLRFPDGSFSFQSDVRVDDAGSPVEVEPLLTEAEELLGEWQEIEAVVPSLDAWVDLAPELPRPTVAVTAEQWKLVVAVGGGATVRTLGDAFEQGELAVSRSVKGLVEAGLATVTTAGVVPVPAPAYQPAPEPEYAREPDPTVSKFSAPELEELAALAEDAPEADRPELARQLAQLGPEAAKAVAAAASAETAEERDAALASIEGEVDGEPINRGLLLKFLSSVRS
jgi:hypothetical protein